VLSRVTNDIDKPLIEDLSLTVDPGQTVAIVGLTGAADHDRPRLPRRAGHLDPGRGHQLG
jgi:ABC-type hemin transport system ATPase subunit